MHIHELNCMHIACANASHLTTVQWSNHHRYICHQKGHPKCPWDPEVNKRTPLDLSLGNKSMQFIPRVPEKWNMLFSPKQCGHTEGFVPTVGVAARCSIEVVSVALGIFPFNFHTTWLLWNVRVYFDCGGSHKTLAPGDASGIFPVNFHTKWLLWDRPWNPLVILGLSACHFGPVASLSLRRVLIGWSRRSSAETRRSLIQSLPRDLVQRALIAILYRDLNERSLTKILPRDLW